MSKSLMCLAGSIAVLGAPASAWAQETTENVPAEAPSRDEIADIVVTAQRRAERLQDVPIAVTAISSDTLVTAGIDSTLAIAQVTPGLTIGTSLNRVQPRIRGVGTSSGGPGIENPVAVYVDGVYYASMPGSLMSLSGIERIEVLKGPQGTLFGRNATGGLIQIVTRNPSSVTTGDVRLNYGNYGTFTADAYVSGPITDDLRYSLTFHSSTMAEGYGTNLFTGNDVYKVEHDLAVRGKLSANLGEVSFTLAGDYSDLAGPLFAMQPNERLRTGFVAPPRAWDVNQSLESDSHTRGGGGSLIVNAPLGFANLTSTTAYRKTRYNVISDSDVSPLDLVTFFFNQSDKQFSQELQLASHNDSPISWVIGAFYFDATAKYSPSRLRLGGFASPVPGAVTVVDTYATELTEALAGYGQASIPLGDATKVTLGLRYNSEKRTENARIERFVNGAGPTPVPVVSPRSVRFDKVTFRAALDRKFTPDILGYLSVDRGFKSGGFNGSVVGDPPFQPEVLDAYQAGVKTDLFSRRLRFNLAGFYYDYSNLQTTIYAVSGQPLLRNSAKAEMYGVDMDVTAKLGARLTVNAGLSLIHARFVSYPNAPFNVPLPTGGSNSFMGDASGNRIPLTPDWTFNIDATYQIPVKSGNVELAANYFHSDLWYGDADNQRFQPAYDLLGGSVTWKMDNGLSVGAWIRNALNEAVAYQIPANANFSGVFFQPPRTYGATVAFSF